MDKMEAWRRFEEEIAESGQMKVLTREDFRWAIFGCPCGRREEHETKDTIEMSWAARQFIGEHGAHERT